MEKDRKRARQKKRELVRVGERWREIKSERTRKRERDSAREREREKEREQARESRRASERERAGSGSHEEHGESGVGVGRGRVCVQRRSKHRYHLAAIRTKLEPRMCKVTPGCVKECVKSLRNV